MFAIATRFPEKLAGQITLQPQGLGVYDVAWGTDTIRVLMLNQVPSTDRNTVLNLFSADPKRIAAGVIRYRGDSHELSSVVTDLLTKYFGEPDMPQTLEEMIRVSEVRVIAGIPTPWLVENLPPEKLREAQALIARRLAKLDKLEKKKPASPRATKSRRKTGTARD